MTSDTLTPFTPCWWLRNSHAQTIAATWFKTSKLPGQLDRVELDDGDFIELIWFGESDHLRPLVLILLGLEGSDDSHYVRSAVRALDRSGFQAILMFHRGCSAEHNRLSRSYHSGETDDFAAVLAHLNRLSGRQVYAVVAYSLGANVLLKYLGERGDAANLDKAIAVSTPFDLHAACIKLDTGLSRVYQRHLVSRLIQRYRDKFKNRKSPLQTEVSSLRSFLEFDEHVTAALNGFEGAIDYYTRSSSRQYLAGIRRPCLIIHASDDPFLPPVSIPSPDELSDSTQLEVYPRGGHVGFIGGGLIPMRWLERAITVFLQK
jgi:predicted alpha/beta-fold hydrolase